MKTRRSGILAVTLAVLIALTSVTMSLARGHMRDAAGTITLCTGTGPISVQVDVSGQPITLVHICPDCAISAFDTFGDSFKWSLPNQVKISLIFETGGVAVIAADGAAQQARGPPSA